MMTAALVGLGGGATPANSAEPAAQLILRAHHGYLPGIPSLIRVELRDTEGGYSRQIWDAEAILTADRESIVLSTNRVALHNGVGSALVTFLGDEDFELTATSEALEATRSMPNLSHLEPVEVAGPLSDGDHEWSGLVHVTGDVTIPSGSTLTLLPGTMVLMDGIESGTAGTDFIVEGAIQAPGTEADPITITAWDPDLPWGEILHLNASPSIYRNVVVTRAGKSPIIGHTFTGPALRVTGSEVEMDRCSVGYISGKILYSSDGSRLTLNDCLLTRATMGPETTMTTMIAEDTWITEMFGPDDNDCVHLGRVPAGESHRLTRCVFAFCDDDAVDYSSTTALFDECIMRDAFDKGISLTHGTTTIRRCLIINTAVGVSMKGVDRQIGNAWIDRTTIVARIRGVAIQNKWAQPIPVLKYFITSSIILARDTPVDTIYTDYDPADIDIRWSNVGIAWPGEGNILADPLFADPQSDFRLLSGSPNIDAGSPHGPLDRDGTRADIGRFAYFQSNAPPRIWNVTLPAEGGLELSLYGILGRDYAIERTVNSNGWNELATVRVNEQPTRFTDAEPLESTSRFYRARLVPEEQ